MKLTQVAAQGNIESLTRIYLLCILLDENNTFHTLTTAAEFQHITYMLEMFGQNSTINCRNEQIRMCTVQGYFPLSTYSGTYLPPYPSLI